MRVYKWFDLLEDTEENPVTRDRIIKWMVDSQYVEGFIGKRISPMDRIYIEDYIQECWVQILEVPEEKLVEIYRKGKGKFTNYIKSIINNNIHSTCSHLYKNIRADKKNELYLNDEEWQVLLEGETSTADVIYPTINREQYTKNNDRVSINVDKINIKADQDFSYEETEDEEW